MTISPTGPGHTFTAQTTEDILAMVPMTLGFHPDDSLVLVTFSRAKNMPAGLPTGALGGTAFHARIDMPTSESDVAAVVEPLRQAVCCHRPQLGAVVVYSADVELGRRTGASAARAFSREGLELVDVVQVHDQEWWEIPTGRRPRSWWPERHRFDLAGHLFLAERVLGGHVVLPSREAVAESLHSGDALDERRVTDAVSRVTDRLCQDLTGQGSEEVRDREIAWLGRLLAQCRPMSPDDVARALTLAQTTTVRDQVCLCLTREVATSQLPVWRELVRRSPPGLVSGAAAVLALVAWLAGDGALAWCAVDRCRESEPDNSLAAHVAAALHGAVPPAAWDGVRLGT